MLRKCHWLFIMGPQSRGVKLQHVHACLERHRACRDTLRWKQAREMAVWEESAAGDVWSMQRGEETDPDAS